MLYFSELASRSVVTSSGTRVGKLSDLVFRAQDEAVVTKIAVKNGGREKLLIPTGDIRTFARPIVVRDDYAPNPLSENELFVTKNLLDQQVIDIKGNKIVRVNDVVIQDRPSMTIVAVDIGLHGILRWFGLADAADRILRLFGKPILPKYLSWADIHPLELARGKVVVRKEEQKLNRIPPEDLADHLEKMNIDNISRLLDIMDEELESEVVENLTLPYQRSLFRRLTPDKAARIIDHIDPDEAVDVLLSISDKKREHILSLLPDDKYQEITELLSYSDTAIGGLLTSEFLTCSPEDTVQKVKQKIRKSTVEFSFLTYIYVVNNKQQVTGVINLHELIMNRDDTPVYKIMLPNVAAVYLTTPVKTAMKKILRYRIVALPVIDEKKHILGIVTYDDLTAQILQELSS